MNDNSLFRETRDSAINECANILNINRSEASLMAGEMAAQEWRTVEAILKALQSRMHALGKNKEK